ncbi:MAG: tetratricopeptide repeat protein [Thermodesulfobacteriota bacterium]
MNRYIKISSVVLSVFLILLFCDSSSAAEINGVVTATTESAITIDIEGDLLPNPGDEVKVGFITPEGDYVPTGRWRVSSVDGKKVTARRADDDAEADLDHVAVIHSSAPRQISKTKSHAKTKQKTGTSKSAKKYYKEGSDFYNGRGREKNHREAAKQFRKASEMGHIAAQKFLGYMYEHGHGVEQSYREAIKWYRLAAEQGNATSQSELGFLYEYGKGVEIDFVMAVKWYRMAAEQGHANGQSNLAKAYYYGKGMDRNLVEAAIWFKRSSEQGYDKAIYYLAWMYDHGEGGLPKDSSEAVRLYREAARKGHKSSQKELNKKNLSW